MNIALIDDHLMMLDSLKASLKQAIPKSNIKIFQRAKAFLSNNFDEWSPDIIITDVMMPEMSGVEMVKKSAPILKKACKIIFLSAVTDIALIKNAVREGAHGFVGKEAGFEELLMAIDAVQQDKQYISHAIKDDLLSYMLSSPRAIETPLSHREREVLQKLCEGRSAKEIAFDLNLSYNTIQLYNTAILRKLNVNRTIDAVTFAINSGLYQELKSNNDMF